MFGGLAVEPPWVIGVSTMPDAGPWRFPHWVEVPRFLFDKKLGRSPRDLENLDGYWLVSAAMKTVLEATDAEACEFCACETVLASGEPGPERWLCTITRAFLGSVDIDATEGLLISKNPNGSLAYTATPMTKLRFRRDVVGSAHLFHVVEISSNRVYCDQAIKDACKAAGLRGIRFRNTPSR